MYLKQYGIEAGLHESVEQNGIQRGVQLHKGIRCMMKTPHQVNRENVRLSING